jgi:predicted CXXCH cytochrome family protein
MSRWRGRLTLLACLVAGAWVVAAPTRDGGHVGGVRLFQQDRLASKGPVARPHAMWETKCEACHNPFIPINDSRWSPSLAAAPQDGGSGRCQTCHAGPSHHASERKEDVPSCAECHRDHRGRDASLLAMDDSACTSCHQNLADHRDKSAVAKVTAEQVTRFDADPAVPICGPRRVRPRPIWVGPRA